ncbi:MAG: hydroxyacylglutathione hydrolase [Cohaesibacteraceae bacterium]|nr:hydroxyacylglutathione hydrolase [Cohaesibacteraceae bacterium]
MIEIVLIPCLSDNYAVLLHDPQSLQTLLIDAPEVSPIIDCLDEKGWRLTDILITHHHFDHVQGLPSLKSRDNACVRGPNMSKAEIGYDYGVSEGSSVQWSGRNIIVIETPGHTLDHVTYFIASEKLAFCGDTMFTLGCGRIFEGTPDMMWNSMMKIASLPSDTICYSGHEYTGSNARFAVTIDPENQSLLDLAKSVSEKRSANLPTVPTILATELKTNPYLRTDDEEIRNHLNLQNATDAEVFAEIRRRKDNFSG